VIIEVRNQYAHPVFNGGKSTTDKLDTNDGDGKIVFECLMGR
tara:strand:- start:13346 stop:13471 length:126 start_codon:yes stop_codon:yes gene_type:complete